jgi:myosin heavy chain 9/10/11/14
LDKQLKELNLRIVDQETKAFTSSPRPAAQIRRLEARIEELTAKLEKELKEKAASGQLQRNTGKAVMDVQFKLAESERARVRLEEERGGYEDRITQLRKSLDEAVGFSLEPLVSSCAYVTSTLANIRR